MPIRWSFFFQVAGVAGILWVCMHDKYPELIIPFLILYVAVAEPHFVVPEFERNWKQLDSKRVKAARADDMDEAAKIEVELEKLAFYNIPLTLGHLNTFRSDLDKRLLALENAIQRKLADGSDG